MTYTISLSLIIFLFCSITKNAFVETGQICPRGTLVDPPDCAPENVIPLNYGAGIIQEKIIQNKVCCAITCGQRILDRKNEFPSAVAIMKSLGINNIKYFICGGTVINKEVILTTAHCVENYKMIDLEIQAGLWNVPKIESFTEKKLQTGKLRKIILHGEFDRATHKNNIALLLLAQPLKFNDYVGMACPPTIDFNYDSTECVALQGENVIENMEINNVDDCQTKLRSTKLGNDFILHESFICAIGRNGEDTCEGDGGKGLLCLMENTGNRYALVGLVSWGIDGCRNKNIPGVYVNVTHFHDWIDSKLEENGIVIPEI